MAAKVCLIFTLIHCNFIIRPLILKNKAARNRKGSKELKMFNHGLQEKARAKMESADKEYQIVATDVTKKAAELYEKRKATAKQTIQACEEYVNTLANSPKEFDKAVSEFKVEFAKFTEVIEKINNEADEAALASALGQAVIPVPVLGAVLGTIAGRIET